MTKILVDGVTMEAKREVVLTFPDKTTATISKNEKGGAIDVSISAPKNTAARRFGENLEAYRTARPIKWEDVEKELEPGKILPREVLKAALIFIEALQALRDRW